MKPASLLSLPALCLLPMLGGCATSHPTPLSRSLPPPPSIMQPVGVPSVTPGRDARAALAEHRAALAAANGRLTGSRAWYESVRSSYGDGGSPR